jgi:hypothetical protein
MPVRVASDRLAESVEQDAKWVGNWSRRTAPAGTPHWWPMLWVHEYGDAAGCPAAINETEAAVVRHIFQMAGDGVSLRGIAKRLNAQGVPSTRPRAGKRCATWCPSAIRAMLRRELYAGMMIWNKSRFVKQLGTNKRLRRSRPQCDWRSLKTSLYVSSIKSYGNGSRRALPRCRRPTDI